MANKRFRFVSPGIQIQEIDNSFYPKATPPEGAVVIGRSEFGPVMRPVTVNSLSDFVNTFGNAIPGKGSDTADVWRDGNYAGPTYGAYAAQAYLKAGIGPVTYIRLAGTERSDRNSGATRAGWQTSNASYGATQALNGGAYGLFIWPSASHATNGTRGSGAALDNVCSGTLAAVWYLNNGAIALSGSPRHHHDIGAEDFQAATSASAMLMKSDGDYHTYKVVLRDSSNNQKGSPIQFNFNPDSDQFIRKVFNTNPQLTNSSTTQSGQLENYWLGQTYEGFLQQFFTGSTASTNPTYNSGGNYHAAILAVDDGTYGYARNYGGFQNAETPWFISQDLQNYGNFDVKNQQQLFKLVALDQGASIMNKIKVSIRDIKISQNADITEYGSFTVQLRLVQDTDNAVQVIETYTNCNLNPNSENFIGRKIGDKYIQWDETERRYREYGTYNNNSSYVRVELNEDVELGATNALFLPYGFKGPTRPQTWTYISGATGPAATPGGTVVTSGYMVKGTEAIPQTKHTTSMMHTGDNSDAADVDFSGSITYPRINMRLSASAGMTGKPTNSYFGLQTTLGANPGANANFDRSYYDIIKPFTRAVSPFTPASTPKTEYSVLFSLDDLKESAEKEVLWVSGSRVAGGSLTSASYGEVLTRGYDKFTAPMHGGFDGVDITEKEPFRNTVLADASEKSHYAYATIQRAIETVADPEVVEFNLVSVPGITDETLTSRLMNVCEDRGDALAIIDPKGGFVPQTENTSAKTANIGAASTVVSNMKSRKPDTSYGAAYYPWVQIMDNISNSLLWVPPSVVMMGAIASSERVSGAPWFAPAGFNRGGLSESNVGGFPVLNVTERLTKRQRDDLYEVNINPIAKFPREGIVVFGQKTLQQRPSALDRVNVRRLMIYLKKAISRVAASILFEQNVQATWDRFVAASTPILADAKSRFGIREYKLTLDETTTTPDLMDQNAVYAKIAIKPAKAIEYIFIDFNITNQGASFDD